MYCGCGTVLTGKRVAVLGKAVRVTSKRVKQIVGIFV